MSLRLTGAFVSLALLAGCGLATPPPDTARVAANSFGQGVNPPIGAINVASWAFASAARTHDRPIEAARALAALDYAAGVLSSSPQFAYVSPIPKLQLLQARTEVRESMGIEANASSQQVVDGLLAAANAMAAGNMEAAQHALQPPVFPPDMLQRLNNLPYSQIANISTTQAANSVQYGVQSSSD